jgi:hypothetical protein
MSDNHGQTAKIAATRFGAVRHPLTDAEGTAKVMLEYVFLSGTTYRAAKYEVSVLAPKNEQDFKDSVKDALVYELREHFPTEDIRAKDIMLFGF